ncbi:MAG: VOC family protein [Candidatus Zixiibacteriota bacterium]
MLKSLSPMLYTRELKETVDFYVTVLGFVCHEFREDWGWAVVEREGIHIMFARPNEHIPFDKPLFTGSFYIYSDNVDQLWHQLHEKTSICYPIQDFFYNMREFAIYDNNGYLLQFGQEIADPDASSTHP